jgi:FKBP-type peptidyl-prolyl cis-trans isomerase FkpA
LLTIDWVHRLPPVFEGFRMSLSVRLPRVVLYAVCLALAAAGCGGEGATAPSPTVNVPFAQSDLRVGTGADATNGRVLTVNYTGWLYDASKGDQKGAQFDSSIGRSPFAFTLGAGQVIRGWDQGVSGMKVGGLRRLVIPPSLGYGSVANGPIPANSTLVFEVELLGVQ